MRNTTKHQALFNETLRAAKALVESWLQEGFTIDTGRPIPTAVTERITASPCYDFYCQLYTALNGEAPAAAMAIVSILSLRFAYQDNALANGLQEPSSILKAPLVRYVDIPCLINDLNTFLQPPMLTEQPNNFDYSDDVHLLSPVFINPALSEAEQALVQAANAPINQAVLAACKDKVSALVQAAEALAAQWLAKHSLVGGYHSEDQLYWTTLSLCSDSPFAKLYSEWIHDLSPRASLFPANIERDAAQVIIRSCNAGALSPIAHPSFDKDWFLGYLNALMDEQSCPPQLDETLEQTPDLAEVESVSPIEVEESLETEPVSEPAVITPPPDSADLTMRIIGGCIAILGIVAVALAAFALLNAASLVVGVVGAAMLLTGVGLFASSFGRSLDEAEGAIRVSLALQ